jgi:Ca-activated chloride channel family protein
VLELERKEEEIIPPVIIPETPDTLVASSETTTQEIEIEIQIEEHVEPTTDLTEIAQAPPSLTDLDKDNFDPQFFNSINVVFVLDISSSMKQVDKMELMKYSLNRLTDLLRAQDKIGLVTYSSYADVLLPPTSGGDKNDIREKVEDLKAFGYTAGGTGIKLGFKQAKKGYIQNGVNHVVIITDGAFNRNSDDYKRYVKRYTKKGIHFSVVGIKNKPNDEDEMREAAKLGQGHYVPIFGLIDAQENLRQMVRLLTYKE